jgi:hypothetical protein
LTLSADAVAVLPRYLIDLSRHRAGRFPTLATPLKLPPRAPQKRVLWQVPPRRLNALELCQLKSSCFQRLTTSFFISFNVFKSLKVLP